MSLRTMPAWLIGLVQSAAVLCYILLFTIATQILHDTLGTIPDNPLIDMPIFLMTFVFSALVCGGAILGYPLALLFEKRVRRAATVVLWSAAWLAAFVGTALVIAMSAVR